TDRAVLRRGRGPGDDDAGHGAAVRVPRRHAIRRGQGITEIPVLLVATAFHQLGGRSRCARPRAAANAPAAARDQDTDANEAYAIPTPDGHCPPPAEVRAAIVSRTRRAEHGSDLAPGAAPRPNGWLLPADLSPNLSSEI